MDNEFLLLDRIDKIQAINKQYDLEHNSYIAFSGGKDSCVLSALIDLALPNNQIPRVYANTGIEYNMMVKFVKELAKTDKRIVVLNQTRNIKDTLETYGYPFKSKEHSLRVDQFNKGTNANFIKKYLGQTEYTGQFMCPKILMYQFEHRGGYHYSNQCCYKLKKDLMHQYAKGKFKMLITGMKNEEGGNRARLTCLSSNNTKFHPLIVVSEEWEEWFIKEYNVKLCELYYPPYNFKRTGCKGCPYSLDLQKDLDTMKELLPNEYKQCWLIWGKVYKEYKRLGYRLRPYDLFDIGDDIK